MTRCPLCGANIPLSPSAERPCPRCGSTDVGLALFAGEVNVGVASLATLRRIASALENCALTLAEMAKLP